MKNLIKLVSEKTKINEELFVVEELNSFVNEQSENLSTSLLFELAKRSMEFPSIPHYTKEQELVESTMIMVDSTVYCLHDNRENNSQTMEVFTHDEAQSFVDKIISNLQAITF